jgi:uncharacterized protein YlxW (UPF0749 family)
VEEVRCRTFFLVFGFGFGFGSFGFVCFAFFFLVGFLDRSDHSHQQARASGQATGKTERAARRQVCNAKHEIRETQEAVVASQTTIRDLQAKIDAIKRKNM